MSRTNYDYPYNRFESPLLTPTTGLKTGNTDRSTNMRHASEMRPAHLKLATNKKWNKYKNDRDQNLKDNRSSQTFDQRAKTSVPRKIKQRAQPARRNLAIKTNEY